MRHIPTTHRIEPRARAASPATGAAVPLADPYWMLGRQWWVGECRGHDGGAPVAARIEVAATPLGPGGDGAARDVVPSSLGAAPLPDPATEGGWRAALRLGREALARIDAVVARLREVAAQPGGDPSGNLGEQAEALGRQRDGLAERFPLTLPAPVAPRVPPAERVDGIALLAALRRGADPAGAILSNWVAHHAGTRLPDAPDPFRIETGRTGIEIARDGLRLRAEMSGTELHWSDVIAEEAEIPGPLHGAMTRPATLSFEGDLPMRWWTLEDARLRWSSAPAGPGDMGQLLVAAAFAEQGGEWWLVGVDAPANAVVEIGAVRVTDGFGATIRSEVAPPPGWTPRGPAGASRLVTLNQPVPLHGPAVEIAALIPDEADNLLWLIERTVPDALGRPRTERPPRPPAGAEEASYLARVAPPANWTAYRPAAPDRMERAALGDPTDPPPPPRTTFARPAYDLTSATIDAAGRAAESLWVMARSPSGHRHVWLARRARPAGRVETSGLLHDQVVHPEV